MAPASLPELPAAHKGLARYIAQNPDRLMVEIMKPYREYEAQLRSVYAQDRSNPLLNDPYLNVVPLFNDDTECISTRARNLAAESEEEKSKYIMVLPDDKRRPHGSPATVANISEFENNFNIFSEASLGDLNWDNVVAAGSSVVNCLLPVPKEFNKTKRSLREYYHEKFCPASDVDLFLYGLTHDQATEKIKQIERTIRDALLNEVTVVRTKYAITIASQYPVRHVQIVLRVYKSVSEILTGFDIDAAGGAYDGKQVYVTPRALASFITQINHVDLTRRSPSYENRLSKYSHRNFEVYWSELDRARIDPTIFERSFKRTLGLARLLVLERLPTTSARETYLNKRRQERGRPTVYRGRFQLGGNIKDYHEDEVADWLSEEEVSNYHTFTVPYGQKFDAKRIEKLCYTRDLLLNAEWNQPSDRPVYLHRHPAFFGRVQDVIEDCCGSCPKAVTPEEMEVAEKEAEIYISGKVSFLIDDPGRQQIGSFNPLTEQDWTDMAYVGNTARLCQSIVDGDLEDVLNWLSQEDADPNKRDYTGRAPLHLAVSTSTPEVVQALIQNGARITARLADGKTALHLAASRGSAEMIKLLMDKSLENEEDDMDRQARRRAAAKTARSDKVKDTTQREDMEVESDDSDEDADDDSDGELIDEGTTEAEVQSIATGSFVNVKKESNKEGDAVVEDSGDEPDYYQIDVLAWDVPCSPLHLAIVEGNEEAVTALCDYGADSMLPVKFSDENVHNDAAILTLVLPLKLPFDKANSMAKLLLRHGATCSQADTRGLTALQECMRAPRVELFDTLWENNKTGVKAALNHVHFPDRWGWHNGLVSPLHSAIENQDPVLVLKLLDAGALAEIDFNTWLKSAKMSPNFSNLLTSLEQNQKNYKVSTEQPLISAVSSGEPDIVSKLLDRGADPNALTLPALRTVADRIEKPYEKCSSALDVVRNILESFHEYEGESSRVAKPELQAGVDTYLQEFTPGTWKYWVVKTEIEEAKGNYKKEVEKYEQEQKRISEQAGAAEKQRVIQEGIAKFEAIEDLLVDKGAKTFNELHPWVKHTEGYSYARRGISAMDKTKPYEVAFSFNDKDLTETRRDAYIELMEAAWSGNLDCIESLTLQAWGDNKDQPPLRMAVAGGPKACTPFSLAFLNGHYEVAKAILEIVKAQWSPKEGDKVRYRMNLLNENDDNRDYGDDDDASVDGIVSEKADKKFTIENIGQVSMQVASHTKPLSVICERARCLKVEDGNVVMDYGSRDLLEHVIDLEDDAGLKFLLDLALHYAAEDHDGDDEDAASKFSISQSTFLFAIRKGRTQQLSTLIKRTGAGIPLDHLVGNNGGEATGKPKSYQGLSVYGKKRRDWATAGRNMVVRRTGIETPPLLHAATAGSLDSVEFFLSDKPHRLYSEFMKSKMAHEDSRIRAMQGRPGGFDRVIANWLGAENDLVIHCACLAQPTAEAQQLLEYLVQTCPAHLEKKTARGETPLMTACRMGRPSFAKILIDARADQSVRSLRGENLLHAALASAGDVPAHRLGALLDLLDPALRGHMFLQRRNLADGGATPLHSWVERVAAPVPAWHHPAAPGRSLLSVRVDTLGLLLRCSGGAELEMLNGAGETCLHTATMGTSIAVAKVLVDFRPQILYRENAVGRTPAELAHDRVLANQISRPRPFPLSFQRPSHGRVLKQAPSDFADKFNDPETTTQKETEAARDLGLSSSYPAPLLATVRTWMGLEPEQIRAFDVDAQNDVIWDLCSTAMGRHPGARRLVSLNEANDVARRLGEQYTGSRYFSVTVREDDDEQGAERGESAAAKREDFATREMASLESAWSTFARDGPDSGLELCEECQCYHD